MKKILLALVLSVCSAIGFADFAAASNPSPYLAEYSTPGAPYQLAVESPGHVWATQPGQNSIVRLIVNSPGSFTATSFAVPTPSSEPYDIKYGGGFIWFTERLGNKIGRLNPATGSINECTIPTPNSQPTGIDVLPGSPAQVWFAERNGNKLARLVGDNPLTCTFTEYATSSSWTNAQPEAVVIQDEDHIWFTAPGVSSIGRLQPSRPEYIQVPTLTTPSGSPSKPWAMAMDDRAALWFTDLASNRIAKFSPGTLSLNLWYILPDASGYAADLQSYAGLLWFTVPVVNTAGQLDPITGSAREFILPANGTPVGLGIAADGTVWLAEYGRNAIASWSAPYFNFIFMPMAPKVYIPN